jgi:hypothetical protein
VRKVYLYKVTGYNSDNRNLVELTVAENESAAEAIIKEKYKNHLNSFYSFDAERVFEVDGYTILVKEPY